jgi:hypothetical protein
MFRFLILSMTIIIATAFYARAPQMLQGIAPG